MVTGVRFRSFSQAKARRPGGRFSARMPGNIGPAKLTELAVIGPWGLLSARRLDRAAGGAGAPAGLVEALAQLIPGLTAAGGRHEAGAPGPERQALDAVDRLGHAALGVDGTSTSARTSLPEPDAACSASAAARARLRRPRRRSGAPSRRSLRPAPTRCRRDDPRRPDREAPDPGRARTPARPARPDWTWARHRPRGKVAEGSSPGPKPAAGS